jgi:hypothetical protein
MKPINDEELALLLNPVCLFLVRRLRFIVGADAVVKIPMGQGIFEC